MEKIYLVKKFNEEYAGRINIWDEVPTADIDNCPWDENGYRPRSEAKVYYTDEAFHVLLKSFENEIKAVYENINDPVCKDSCLEFFINPAPETDNRYLNFEFNPLGTMLLGLGEGRNGRKLIELDWRKVFKVKTSVTKENLKDFSGPFWTVEFMIPFDFLRDIYGPVKFESGSKMRGNFYKCGDKTEFPHYLCWNNIINEKPDFHLPQFFGQLILE